jgi:hypothetical protein
MEKRTPNYKCVVCSNDMYVRPSAIKKSSGWGFACCKKCGIENRSKHTKGIANHQFGIKGENNSSFKGDTKISTYGYVLKYKPDHKRANQAGYVWEHLLVMEDFLGRELKYFGNKHKDNEVCHHIDRNKKNNHISNLQLMTESEHTKLHIKEDNLRSIKAGVTRSVIKKEDIDKIVSLYLNGISQKEIGKMYSVSQSVISNVIKKGRYCYGK